MRNRLSHSLTQSENAVEEFFCKPFENLNKSPMDSEESEILIRLLMGKKGQLEIPEKEKPFLYSMIEKRIEHCFTFSIKDSRLILFLTMITESPGTAVMYLAYLQYWCKKNDIKEVDLDIFCTRIFPTGFPSQDDLQNVWDGQKVERDENGHGSDNLLDYSSAYASIHFMQEQTA